MRRTSGRFPRRVATGPCIPPAWADPLLGNVIDVPCVTLVGAEPEVGFEPTVCCADLQGRSHRPLGDSGVVASLKVATAARCCTANVRNPLQCDARGNGGIERFHPR